MQIIIDGVTGTWTPDEQAPIIPEGYLSENFREAEFDCNHCGRYGKYASLELLDVLEDVRAHFGDAPVTVNSGVRCEQHNRNVGGEPNSRHLPQHADAADIVVSGIAPSTVHAYLSSKYAGKYGLGSYSSFTHIDTRPNGPARW